jgi:hypothetical protein
VTIVASRKRRIVIPILAVGLIVVLGVVIAPLALYPKCDIIGPYYHKIYSATSVNGLSWTVNNTVIFDHASVPGAVYFNSKLYLYFVNAECGEKLSVAISDNYGNSFAVYDVAISGSNSPRPVDPNPIVDGGLIRLTYLGNLGGNPANIVTAHSSDGINFVEDAILFSETSITDPDLFHYSPSEWILFVDQGSTLLKANGTSISMPLVKDSTFSFSGILCSTHYINGRFHTYYLGSKGISVAEYNSSGLTVLAEDLITGFTGFIGDPTVVVFGPGNYLMYFKQTDIPP